MGKISKKHLGDFTINLKEIIEKDEYSKIYPCSHTTHREKLAVRIFSMKMLQEHDFIKKSFYMQVLIMKMLDTEAILKFYSVIESENNFYIIMENLQGHTLKQFLNRKKVISETVLMKFLGGLNNLFNQMYKHKIVHGSLNPNNIFITQNKAKIGNFVDINSFINPDQIPQDDKNYMAPEFVLERKNGDKSDVWSLGMIIYRSLVGKTPWAQIGVTQETFFKKEWCHQIEFPEQEDDGGSVSPQFRSLINGCLKVKEQERFSWPEFLLHPVFENL